MVVRRAGHGGQAEPARISGLEIPAPNNTMILSTPEPRFRQGASVQGRAEAVTSVVSVLRCTYRHTSSLYTLSDVLPVITSTVTSAMTSRDRDGVSWQASRSVTHVQYSLRRASPFGLTKQLCQRHEGAYSVPTRALRDTPPPVPAALLPPPCRPGHTTLLPATL